MPFRQIRALSRDSLRGVTPNEIQGGPPTVEVVDPTTLYVEESYQREADGETSTRQVRKIVGGFDWTKFKLPVCVRLEDGRLVVIDGQHTAIACASHPGVTLIPVAVVSAASAERRAMAFVGHNRDRIGLTQMAIHHAEVAAGEDEALKVHRACEAAGVKIHLKPINFAAKWDVGVTIAIGALRIVARDDGEEALTRTLRVLVAAQRGPIRAEEISAVAHVIRGKPPEADAKLVQVVGSRTAEAWRAAAAMRALETNQRQPLVLAGMWAEALGLTLLDRKQARKVAAAPPPPPPPPPPPKPQPKPPAPPAPPKAPAPAPTAAAVIERNGVRVSPADCRLERGGDSVALTPSETDFVGTLVRVMPAIIATDALGRKVYGRVDIDTGVTVRALADRVRPKLERLGLTVKEIPKMGYALSEK